MPDFVPVLVVAVLSLIALLIVFGGTSLFMPGGFGGGGKGSPSTSKTFALGQDLVVMYVEGQKNLTQVGGEVSQGLFGRDVKKINFAVDDYRDASEGVIKLKTWNSNYYGDFLIEVNGQKVFVGAPVMGDKTIIFDGNVFKADNILEIEAESSGWKIWAPTVYIFDANLSVNYIGKKTQSLTFDLTNKEITNVNRARLLIFGTRDGTGDLTAKLNGREIFSGLTTVYTDFAIDALKAGNNTLDLSTEKNTRYNITSVQIVLFF